MYRHIQFKIKGIVPLIQHNGQLCDPLNPVVKQMKKLTGKQKKTDEIHDEIAELEWIGGLYLNNENRVIMPGECLESAFIKAAMKNKMGPKAKAGVIIDGGFLLEYDGPKTLDGLKKKRAEFSDRRRVVVQRSAIMRTRPIFRNWSLTFTIDYLSEQLNESDVIDIVNVMGEVIGLCDHRPRFGRFIVEEVAVLKDEKAA